MVVTPASPCDGLSPEIAVKIERADGAKCERCWKYTTDVGADPQYPTACASCAAVARALVPAAPALLPPHATGRPMIDSRVKLYGLSAIVFAVDRLTKSLIEAHVSPFDVHRVIPGFFDIVHSQNRGVAFGIMNDTDSVWRTVVLIAFSAAAMILVAGLLWRASRLDRWTATGLSLVLGGAAGNLFDRIVWGRVTDFLEFYIGDLHWPTFNVADSCIVIGSGLLLLDLLRPKRQPAGA